VSARWAMRVREGANLLVVGRLLMWYNVFLPSGGVECPILHEGETNGPVVSGAELYDLGSLEREAVILGFHFAGEDIRDLPEPHFILLVLHHPLVKTGGLAYVNDAAIAA